MARQTKRGRESRNAVTVTEADYEDYADFSDFCYGLELQWGAHGGIMTSCEIARIGAYAAAAWFDRKRTKRTKRKH